MASEKALAQRAIQPKKHAPKKEGDLRIFPDGATYRVTPRGWRRVRKGTGAAL